MADYDYTRDDNANTSGASSNGADDYEIGDYKPGQSADTIEKENGFRTVPPGDHLLVVGSVFLGDKDELYPVILDGKADSFSARKITVNLCLPSDPRSQVRDFFVLPPSNPRDKRAYDEGIGKDAKPGAKGGFAAKKFSHFAARLGLLDPATETLNAIGKRPSQWKGRAIQATIKQGTGTYTNKTTGEVKPSDNQVALFSYRPADAAAMASQTTGKNGANGNSGNTTIHSGGQATRGSVAPAAAMSAIGLDDL